VLAYLLSVLAGAALPLAFAPFEQFWVAPLAYAVLFHFWDGATPRRALGVGFAFGCTAFGAGTYWTFIAVREFGEAPLALALFLTIGLVAVLALFVGTAGFVAARWFRARGPVAWLVTFPAVWVIAEWLRGWAFSGFGWLSAGYSQTDSWLMGYAPLAGVHAMGLAVLLTAGALLALVRGDHKARAAALGVLLVVWGVGAVARNHAFTSPTGSELRVALVQGAVHQDLKWRPEELPGTMQLYGALTRQSVGADLVIWPEAAIPTLYEYVPQYLEALRRETAARGSTVLLGILRRNPSAPDSDTFQNILVALTDKPQIYVKRHLVPFGEYFPVPAFVRDWMRLMNLPYTDAVPGAADQPTLDVDGQRIAPTICYEDVFGAEQLHYLPSATLLVNVSNDAWFGDSIAPHQHLQIARVRAAEAGRYMLRATNTGVTAVIDPSGDVVRVLPQFEPGVILERVQGFTGATPYARVGNVPVLALVLAALVAELVRQPAPTRLFRQLRRPRAP
jgi:apolipoprotein N-acyltransferase